MKITKDFSLLMIIALMYATVCIETDIYVPSFPDMKLFFQTSDEAIQQILSINFIGICFGSLLFRPLSDAYGRRIILQLGLLLFTVASFGCLFFAYFETFLVCRFVQGFGAAAPMVIAFAMILEKYEPQKVAQLCGGLNLFITGMMAIAPILGSILNIYFGWQSNFLLIAVLTIGITLAAPIYGMESANVFPHMRGIGTGMNNALRHVIVAVIVGIGSMTFTGSITPVVLLIAGSTAIIVILALLLLNQKRVASTA